MKTIAALIMILTISPSFAKEAKMNRKPNQQLCAANLVSDKMFIREALKQDLGDRDITNIAYAIGKNNAKNLITFTFTDGSTMAFDAWQECSGEPAISKHEDTAPKVKFECREWQNCMPMISKKDRPYCTKEYEEWTVKNCEKKVNFAY